MSDSYIQGFNEGYLLAAYLPEVAYRVEAVEGASSRMVGFRDGCLQYTLEQMEAVSLALGRQEITANRNNDAEH